MSPREAFSVNVTGCVVCWALDLRPVADGRGDEQQMRSTSLSSAGRSRSMAMADKPDSRQVAGFGPTFFNLCNVTLGAGILSYPVRARALSLRTTARSTTS
jgi:hypothetical protein